MKNVLDRLYLGTLHNARQLSVSNTKNITFVVNCSNESLVGQLPENVGCIQLNLLEGEEISYNKLSLAIDIISRELKGIVLVCCTTCKTRSAAITAAYLYSCGVNWETASTWLVDRIAGVELNSVEYRSVKKILGIEDVLRSSIE